ncbi:MAG: FtsW/RodA/SpoVE family cell cycle protein [bacterium]|nr:FtsW/RodA/SpoVE family cell cycle protein [bacterium]
MKLKKMIWNKSIIICLACFMIISIFTIHSAQLYLSKNLGNLALKQLIWYLIGTIIIMVTIQVTNQKIYQNSKHLYFLGNILLFGLLLFAPPINNSKCWFIIPGIGSFQPSEFMKIFLILIISTVVSKEIENKKSLTWKEELLLLVKVGFLFLIPAILTFLEPDTGVVIIYFIVTIAILFTSTIRKKWFLIALSIILLLGCSFLYLYFFNQEVFVNIFGTDLFYRIDRLLDWKNGTGMQLENSLTAIGSSGIFGHGFKQTPIYFPESGTDFIFAVYASNFGLIGSILIVILIAYFDLTLIKIAKNARENTDKFVLIGITCMLVFQQFQNIAMTLGVLPITGITLPFISYGGSSLLSYMFVMGIVLNIYYDQKKTIN